MTITELGIGSIGNVLRSVLAAQRCILRGNVLGEEGSDDLSGLLAKDRGGLVFVGIWMLC